MKEHLEHPSAGRLARVLNQTNGDGEYLFSRADLQHFIPLCLIATGDAVDWNTLPLELQSLMQDFVTQLGLDAEASAEDLQVQLERHYSEHPVNPHLLRALCAFTREELLQGLVGNQKHVFAQVGQDLAKNIAPGADVGGRRPASQQGPVFRRFEIPEK